MPSSSAQRRENNGQHSPWSSWAWRLLTCCPCSCPHSSVASCVRFLLSLQLPATHSSPYRPLIMGGVKLPSAVNCMKGPTHGTSHFILHTSGGRIDNYCVTRMIASLEWCAEWSPHFGMNAAKTVTSCTLDNTSLHRHCQNLIIACLNMPQ